MCYDVIQVPVARLLENAVFRTPCCGQHTPMKHCRSWYHRDYWSTSSVKTPMVFIVCRAFHTSICPNCTAMHSTSAVRSVLLSTSVRLLLVLVAQPSRSIDAYTVTVITALDASVNARLAYSSALPLIFRSILVTPIDILHPLYCIVFSWINGIQTIIRALTHLCFAHIVNISCITWLLLSLWIFIRSVFFSCIWIFSQLHQDGCWAGWLLRQVPRVYLFIIYLLLWKHKSRARTMAGNLG